MCQGGILLLLFSNSYMDEQISTLNDTKAGCMMNGVIFNHLMCIDDLVSA